MVIDLAAILIHSSLFNIASKCFQIRQNVIPLNKQEIKNNIIFDFINCANSSFKRIKESYFIHDLEFIPYKVHYEYIITSTFK